MVTLGIFQGSGRDKPLRQNLTLVGGIQHTGISRHIYLGGPGYRRRRYR